MKSAVFRQCALSKVAEITLTFFSIISIISFFVRLSLKTKKRKFYSVFIVHVGHLTHSFSVLCRISGICDPKKIFTTWVNSVTKQILWWGPRKEPPSCGTTTSWIRTAAGSGKWTSIQFTEDVQSRKELNGLQITGSPLHTRAELMSRANIYSVLISSSLKTDNSDIKRQVL